ncbi:MAG: folate-binding protein [Pseudomonadota bacterium]
MSKAVWAKDRAILKASGKDARGLLQDLVTNDLDGTANGLVYTALLTPQGKYLFDFFVKASGDDLLLDVSVDRADALLTRLSLYKLRADMVLERADLSVVLGLGPGPEGALMDPRHEGLGWRLYTDDPKARVTNAEPWSDEERTALRVDLAIPEAGRELVPDQSFILEMGFERLAGVDFRKGCYVGQEVTARMKHKTELRQGLVAVQLEGEGAKEGTEIVRDGKSVGQLHSIAGDRALAYLRYDRAGDGMVAGPVKVSMLP